MQLNIAFSSCFATDCLSDALLGERNPLTVFICRTLLTWHYEVYTFKYLTYRCDAWKSKNKHK